MTFLSPSDYRALDRAICDAVCSALKDTTKSEPQLVANLVWQLPRRINEVVLNGLTQIRARGVFVHSRPFVTCSSFPDSTPKSVEIGDLLLIRKLVKNRQVVEQRALLLQAKKTTHIPATPDNGNQWHLYEKWPAFVYAARSGGLNGKPRRIQEPDMYDGAKYLFIETNSRLPRRHCMSCVDYPFFRDRSYSERCCYQTAHATKPDVSRYRCLINELVEYLLGNAGKVFTEPAPRTRGWNRVIQDLMIDTAKAKSIIVGRAANQGSPIPRGSGLMFVSPVNEESGYFTVVSGDVPEEFSKLPEVPYEWPNEGDGGGISIIEIVVERQE